jgi:hypothetical protein
MISIFFDKLVTLVKVSLVQKKISSVCQVISLCFALLFTKRYRYAMHISSNILYKFIYIYIYCFHLKNYKRKELVFMKR